MTKTNERCPNCGRPKAWAHHENGIPDVCTKNLNWHDPNKQGAAIRDCASAQDAGDAELERLLSELLVRVGSAARNGSALGPSIINRIREHFRQHRADSPAVVEPVLVVGRQYRCLSTFLANAPAGTILTFSHFEDGEQRLYNFTQEIHGRKVRRVVTKGDLRLLEPADSPAVSEQELDEFIRRNKVEYYAPNSCSTVEDAVPVRRLRALFAGKRLVSAGNKEAQS
jgi:hypothetical protein